MEIKKGYRQTEAGVIPNDWEVKKLGELGKFSKGQGIRKDEAQSGDTPCVRYGEIYTKHDNVIKEFYSFISPSVAKTAKRIKQGDILFAGSGETKEEIGKCVANIYNEEAYAGGDVVIYSPSNTDSLLLGYLLNSPPIVRQKSSKGQGDAVVHISAKSLKDVVIPLPRTKSEQSAIASVLSETDSLIASLEKLISKKKAVKKGTMQALLTGKIRLPGFTKKWTSKRIGEISNVESGGTPSTLVASYWGGNVRWMNSGELNLKEIYDVENRITELGVKNSSTKLIPRKCVLIGLAGQGKTRGTVAINFVELCTNQSIAAIFPNYSFLSEFLYYNLDSRYDELRLLSAGDGGRGGLNLTIIKNLVVQLPEKDEQIAIAHSIGDMDKELEKLILKLRKYQNLKQGLMEHLLTGKIRLV